LSNNGTFFLTTTIKSFRHALYKGLVVRRESTTTRKTGGVDFPALWPGKTKARQCFNRWGCNPPQADLETTNPPV